MKQGEKGSLFSGWQGFGFAVVGLLCLSACSSESEPAAPPPPTSLAAVIQASTTINPDVRDRPSPVVTRLYELESVEDFSNADFFDLYDDRLVSLASKINRRDEFAIMPLEKLTVERQLRPTTRFIGVIAAYRNIDGTSWRAVVPIEPNTTNRFAVRLEQSGIVIISADEQEDQPAPPEARPKAITPLFALSTDDKPGDANGFE